MIKEQSTALMRAGSQLPATNMADFVEIGRLLAQTGMFGTNNPAEGFVIAAMCHQSGLTYIEFMQQYHFSFPFAAFQSSFSSSTA